MKGLNVRKAASLTKAAYMIIAFVFASSAYAEDYAFRLNSEKRSAKEGLGRDQVPLLERTPGMGRKSMAKILIKRFKDARGAVATLGTAKKQKKGNRLSYVGDGWFLDVNGDGTNVRYRNYKYLDSKPELARPVSARLSNDQLEKLGREFIKGNLSEYILLGTNEELVPFFTEHAIGGGGPAREGAPMDEEKVYASLIVFTRTIDNINVIGAGSKVAIMFNNEGAPVGFDYDWPRYDFTGKFQKVLSVEAIKERAKRFATKDIHSPDVKLKRLECGFYDAGMLKRDPKAVVQAGCAIHYTERKIIDQNAYRQDPNSGHVMTAYVDFIPAGETVEQDGKWIQALNIISKRPDEREPGAPQDGPKQR